MSQEAKLMMGDTAGVLVLQSEGTKALVMIRPDGKVEFDKDYIPEEAARIFWQAIENLNPLRARIDFLTMLAHGCGDHRSYRGKREPRVTCVTCERMYEARQALERMGAL
jgi:hypothetical protein